MDQAGETMDQMPDKSLRAMDSSPNRVLVGSSNANRPLYHTMGAVNATTNGLARRPGAVIIGRDVCTLSVAW